MLDACTTIQMNLNYVAKSRRNSRRSAHWNENTLCPTMIAIIYAACNEQILLRTISVDLVLGSELFSFCMSKFCLGNAS